MRIRTVFSISLSMIVVGCAIRPLPRDVTRDTTLEIITKIRCEARKAIIYELMDVIVEVGSSRNKMTIRWLLAGKVSDTDLDYMLDHIVESRIKLVELLTKNVTIWQLRELSDGHVDSSGSKYFPGTLERINRFRNASINSNFRFLIKEKNNRSGKGIFTMPFTGGTFTLNFGVGVNKNRDNERGIDVTDSFSGLATRLVCTDKIPQKHWIYPITGNIGMKEVLFTFSETVKRGGVDKLTDTLTFTTKILGNLDPKVVLSTPSLKQFKLTEASVSVSDEREDQHEVKLVLKIKPTSTKAELSSVVLGMGSTGETVKLEYRPPTSDVGGEQPPILRPKVYPHGYYLPPVPTTKMTKRGIRVKSLLGITQKESEAIKKDGLRELQFEKAITIERNILDEVRRLR